MKSLLSIVTCFISSLIFMVFFYLWVDYYDGFFTLFMWMFLALQVFLIGGSVTLIVIFYLEKKYNSISYSTSLIIFIFFGVIWSIFSLIYFKRMDWSSSALDYISLGILASFLYFHILLLLTKIATFIETKLSTHTKLTLWIIGISFLIVIAIGPYILERIF